MTTRCGGLLAALTAIALTSATPSPAAWSTPRVITGAVPSYFSTTGPGAFATDARGDAALVWRKIQAAGRPPNVWDDSSVQVAVLDPAGAIVTHTVWRRTHSLIASVTAAVEARGELTIAWIEAPSSSNGPHTLRARHRSATGRWSSVQSIGSSTAFFYARPELAVAPDGEVLLTWNAGSTAGVEAAWRAPGRGFGEPVALNRSKGAAILDPTPVFDPGGGAHVYGTVDCDGRSSRGVMLSTRPHNHHFGAPSVVAPAPAENLLVSFSAPGQALAAWERESCSTLEPAPGPPYARVMFHGIYGAPVALGPRASAYRVTPVAATGGGGTVAWVSQPFAPQAPSVLTATADAEGHFSAAGTPAGGLAPAARDAAGDVVLEDLLLAQEISEARPLTGGSPPSSPVAMQPAAGGAPEPSPLSRFVGTPLALSLSAFATAEPPVGRGAAVVWQNGGTGRVAIATWRP